MAGKFQIVIGIVVKSILVLVFLDGVDSHINFFSGKGRKRGQEQDEGIELLSDVAAEFLKGAVVHFGLIAIIDFSLNHTAMVDLTGRMNPLLVVVKLAHLADMSLEL
jgi:hypothetical protein